MPKITANERMYAEDANGVRRLIAAPGDTYDTDTVLPGLGVITTPADPPIRAPLEGYDQLSEAEVLGRLPDLSADELRAVQAYEQAHQARGSITRYGTTATVVTGAREQPLKLEPEARGQSYEAMNVDDLQAEVNRRNLEVQGSGKDGNVVKADLVNALQADDGR